MFVPGFQGGHHVWGSLQTGRDLGEVDFRIEITTSAGVVAETGYRTELYPSADDPTVFELTGLMVILDYEYDAYDLAGTAATMAATVSPKDSDETFTASVDGVLRCCDEGFGGVGGTDGTRGDGGLSNGPPDGGIALPGGAQGMPRIHAVLAKPSTVAPGGEVELEVIASTTEDELPDVTWSAPAGTLSTASAYFTTWTAPSTTGTVSIQVTASAGGESRSASVDVTVE
jgi:hypothetical protein